MRVKTKVLVPCLLAIFAAQAWMQNVRIYPYWEKYYAPRSDGDYSSLSPDQMLFALAGFREMIAGLLWVRADSYFDQGNYDAILPMVRIVTMLDPKQIDVYATGMWHIAYNFTDEAQRSDRRYIPPAIALGKEGAELNDYSYELYFETGWVWYHKIDDDHEQAVAYFEKATKDYLREDLYARYREIGMSDIEALSRSEANGVPPARRNLLAQVYLRAGNVGAALDLYYKLLTEAKAKVEVEGYSMERINRDTIENNLDNLLVRMSQRGEFARRRGVQDMTGYDVHPPFDVGFSASVTVLDPKVILVEGSWRVMPVGTRIRFILRDRDFEGAVPGGMIWDRGEGVDFTVDNKATFLQDSLFVRNQRFSKKIDMSRDITMYPLASENYVVEFFYNPRSAPAHIQDKFGFNGEGMTDSTFLETTARPGQKVVFCRLEIPKDMLLMTGEYRRGRGKAAAVFTSNFDEQKFGTDGGEVIQVPGLRSN